MTQSQIPSTHRRLMSAVGLVLFAITAVNAVPDEILLKDAFDQLKKRFPKMNVQSIEFGKDERGPFALTKMTQGRTRARAVFRSAPKGTLLTSMTSHIDGRDLPANVFKATRAPVVLRGRRLDRFAKWSWSAKEPELCYAFTVRHGKVFGTFTINADGTVRRRFGSSDDDDDDDEDDDDDDDEDDDDDDEDDDEDDDDDDGDLDQDEEAKAIIGRYARENGSASWPKILEALKALKLGKIREVKLAHEGAMTVCRAELVKDGVVTEVATSDEGVVVLTSARIVKAKDRSADRFKDCPPATLKTLREVLAKRKVRDLEKTSIAVERIQILATPRAEALESPQTIWSVDYFENARFMRVWLDSALKPIGQPRVIRSRRAEEERRLGRRTREKNAKDAKNKSDDDKDDDDKDDDDKDDDDRDDDDRDDDDEDDDDKDDDDEDDDDD